MEGIGKLVSPVREKPTLIFNPPFPEVADLLIQIIEQVTDPSNSSRPQGQNAKVKEVLFVLTMDGVRYSLVRSVLKPVFSNVQLSPREMEIVRLVAKGFPNKSIASVLEISPWTVATHLRRIFTKLSVNSRAEMVAKALK